MLRSRLVARQLSLSRALSSVVNAHYQPGTPHRRFPADVADRPPATSAILEQGKDAILAKAEAMSDWSADDVQKAAERHSMFTWGATGPMCDGSVQAVRGEGVYFYGADGQRYLDWNSQAMCVHHGHTPDPTIVDAVKEQMETMCYMYPGISMVPVRAKLCALLADLFPGDINAFMFPSSGAEANEAAMRIARLYTGRHKILCRYRSYHGGTNATMMATGDLRRWASEPGMPGVKHFLDPYPYSFKWGDDPAEATQRSLEQLAEVISYEGAHNIASIMLESVTGTNGILPPPPGYLEGVRELCDEHGILMHCDEVMNGFGRCGALFGFQRAAPSVVPDLVTFAKGVNGAFIPLGGVGIAEPIAEHFRSNPIMYGSTYNGHPVALASAYAALKVMLRDGLAENALAMESHMQAGFEQLAANHPCIKQARGVGLFWTMDIQKNRAGDFVAEVTDPLTPAMAKFKQATLDAGMFTMMRGHTVFSNPPLIITPEQIQEGFAILDSCLGILDDAMED